MARFRPILARFLALPIATLLAAPAVQAGQIFWNTPGTVTADADVLVTGALGYAYTFSNTAATVNGVAFAGSNSFTTVGTDVTFTGMTSNNTTAFTGGTTNPWNGLSAGYKNLLVGSTFNGSTAAASIQLNNLIAGHTYVTQLWVNDARAGATATRTETVTGGGGNTVTLDFNSLNNVGGVGQFGVGLFQAGTTNQAITLVGNAVAQVNALQLRDVTNLGYWTGTGGATWDASTTTNFATNLYNAALTQDTFAAAKAPLDAVTFGDVYWDNSASVAVTQNAVNVATGGVSAGTVYFNNSALDYTLTSALDGTGITGATRISKEGTGTLFLNGANTHSGGTYLGGGTLSIGNASALGSGPLVYNAGTFTNATGSSLTINNPVTLNATLALNETNNLTFAGVVSGAGGFTKTGSNALTLNGVNTYTGATTLTSGTLNVGNGAALGTGTFIYNAGTLENTSGGALTLGNAVTLNATLALNHTNDLTLSGATSGAGGLTKNGNNTLFITGAGSFTGGVSINAGTLQVGNLGTVGSLSAGGANPVTVSAAATLVFSRSNALTVSNAISGTGPVNFLGTGINQGTEYTLSGDNSGYSGTMTVNNSRVGVDVPADLGTASVVVTNTLQGANPGTGTVWFSGTAATYANPFTIAGNGWQENAGRLGALRIGNASTITNTITLAANAAIGSDSVTAVPTISGPIEDGAGGFSLEKVWTGNLLLTGTNTYSGGTTISNGYLTFVTPASLPEFGDINPTGGGSIVASGVQTTVQGWLASGRLLSTANGSVALAATSSEPIDFTGFNNLGLSSSVAAATYSGALTPGTNGYRFGGTTGSVLTVTSPLTAGNALTKYGTGTTVLNTNANTYTGGTVVNGGELQASVTTVAGVKTTFGTGPIAVNNGATLRLLAGSTANVMSWNNPITLNGGTLIGQDGTQTVFGPVAISATGATLGSYWANKNLVIASNVTAVGPVALRTFNEAAASVILSGTNTFASAVTNTSGSNSFTGANTFTGVTTINGGTLTYGATSVVTHNSGIRVATGTFTNVGNTTITGSAATSDATTAVSLAVSNGQTFNQQGGTLSVVGVGANGTTNISGGTMNVSGIFYMSEQTNAAVRTVNQSGGTLNLNTATADAIRIGHWGGGPSTYNLSGGTFNALASDTNVSWDGAGTLNITGGTANLRGIRMGATAANGAHNAAATLTLNGGRLNLGATGLVTGGTGLKTLTLTSGTLGAFANWTSAAAMALGGTPTVNTLDSVDGATGRTITLSGILSSTGGITKAGAGTLLLSGANTFSGATNVNGGILALNYATSNTSKLSDTSVLTLNGGTVQLNGATGSHPEVVLSTTLAGNAAVTRSGANTATLALGAVTRNLGAVLDAGADNLATTTNTLTNSVLPGFTVNGVPATKSGNNIVALTTFADVPRLGGTIADAAASNARIIESGTTGVVTLGAATTNINTLTNAPTVTAPTTVDLGSQVLRLGATGTISTGAGANGITFQNGTLTAGGSAVDVAGEILVTGAASSTIAAIVADNGTGIVSLGKAGAGTLVLSGVNTYTGQSAVTGGTLSIGANAALGAVGTGAQLNLNGGTLLATATFALENSGAAKRPVAIGAAGGTINVAATQGLTVSGVVAGTGALTKSGNGILTLSSNNPSFSGGITLSQGQLRSGVTQIVGAVTPFGTGPITIGDANSGSAPLTLTLQNRNDVANPVVITSFGTGPVVLEGNNTGSGGDASSFTGQITANRAFTLRSSVAGDRTTVDGKITGNPGTITVEGGSRFTLVSTANDFTGNIFITGTGTVLQSSVAGAAETIPNSTSIDVGVGTTFQIAAAANSTETINALTGSGTITRNVAGLQTLAVGAFGGGGTFSGVISNGVGPVGLTKLGTGTQILTGTSTYTGATTVSVGTLEVNGSISGSAATVNGATATLTGLGTLGATTLSAGTLTPGNGSIGTLNTANLAFNGGTALFELGGLTSDTFNTTGSITFGGNVELSLSFGSDLAEGTAYTLLNNDLSDAIVFTLGGFAMQGQLINPGVDFVYTSGAFSETFQLSYTAGVNGNDTILTVVPEPAAAVSILTGLGLLAIRRRRR